MKKAQAFTQDLIISLVLMSMILLVFFSFYSDRNTKGEDIEQNLLFEAKTITDYLTTTGYPEDWNQSNVIRIGFTDENNLILEDKLEIFSNMSRDEYDKTKSLLKTKYDYLIFFRDYDGNIINITKQSFIGKVGINNTNIETIESPTYLFSISRFVVLKEDDISDKVKIIEMVTYAWTKEK